MLVIEFEFVGWNHQQNCIDNFKIYCKYIAAWKQKIWNPIYFIEHCFYFIVNICLDFKTKCIQAFNMVFIVQTIWLKERIKQMIPIFVIITFIDYTNYQHMLLHHAFFKYCQNIFSTLVTVSVALWNRANRA